MSGDAAFNLRYAVRACRGGVARAHILSYALDGGLLVELFTHDGVGTMVAPEDLEKMRDATADDVGGIIKLIEPLEADGTLVKRPRELIEHEIDRFTVLEHDGFIFGCAALYPFPREKSGELACLTVHPQYQGYGDGERLMKRIEAKAKAAVSSGSSCSRRAPRTSSSSAASSPRRSTTCRPRGSTCTTGSAARRCSSRRSRRLAPWRA